jgi:hypothetical protein
VFLGTLHAATVAFSTAAIRRGDKPGNGGTRPGSVRHHSFLVCCSRATLLPSRIAFRILEDSGRLEGVQALFVPAIFHPSILGTVCKAEILRVKQ